MSFRAQKSKIFCEIIAAFKKFKLLMRRSIIIRIYVSPLDSNLCFCFEYHVQVSSDSKFTVFKIKIFHFDYIPFSLLMLIIFLADGTCLNDFKHNMCHHCLDCGVDNFVDYPDFLSCCNHQHQSLDCLLFIQKWQDYLLVTLIHNLYKASNLNITIDITINSNIKTSLT